MSLVRVCCAAIVPAAIDAHLAGKGHWRRAAARVATQSLYSQPAGAGCLASSWATDSACAWRPAGHCAQRVGVASNPACCSRSCGYSSCWPSIQSTIIASVVTVGFYMAYLYGTKWRASVRVNCTVLTRELRLKQRRTSPQPGPARTTARITDWVFGGVAVLVVIACCGRLWLLLDAIVEGRYVSVIRGRAARIFLAENDPHRFWISIGWDALLTCVPLALIGGFAYATWKGRCRRR